MTFIRAYLRASTDAQDAKRAKSQLDAFIAERKLKVAAWYMENESGTRLDRPELFRLINDAHAGDVLLVEQVDRLSRLTSEDWEQLKAKLAEKRLNVVSLDLPTSWMALDVKTHEGVTEAILRAVNAMLLDVLASVARKDYEDRRRRQAQGIVKAQSEGRFRGKQPDLKRHALIAEMLAKGMSWTQVCEATGCSRSTVKRVLDAQKARDALLVPPAEVSKPAIPKSEEKVGPVMDNKTTKSSPEARPEYDHAKVSAVLDEFFPKLFSETAPFPLEINIHRRMLKHLKTQEPPALEKWQIKEYLKRYCGRDVYRLTLTEGATRYGIDGEAKGAVSKQHAELALAAMNKPVMDSQ